MQRLGRKLMAKAATRVRLTLRGEGYDEEKGLDTQVPFL